MEEGVCYHISSGRDGNKCSVSSLVKKAALFENQIPTSSGSGEIDPTRVGQPKDFRRRDVQEVPKVPSAAPLSPSSTRRPPPSPHATIAGVQGRKYHHHHLLSAFGI